jgi:hypothetical protein
MGEMTLAELLAITKMAESQLIRAFLDRRKVMERVYIERDKLTISENEDERNRFNEDRENVINGLDKKIQSLKTNVLANKEQISEINVTNGIDNLLQQAKFVKIELQHLQQDKLSFRTMEYDNSERIAKLELEKVKVLNKIMSFNHQIIV